MSPHWPRVSPDPDRSVRAVAPCAPVGRSSLRGRRAGPFRRQLSLAAVSLLASACANVPATPAASAGPGVVADSGAFGTRVVDLRSDSTTVVRGWFIPGQRGAGAVLLLHGVGSTHRDMMGRARFLHAAGYSVFAIDFRGHGRSADAPVTFGAAESRDAHAALAFLRDRLPNDRIAVIGESMGGAASLLGSRPLRADAFILESVYATIDSAVYGRARAWLGPLGHGLGTVFLRAWLPRSGVSASELRPIDRVGQLTVPVYVISGANDRYTSLGEARALFDRVPGPKEFWAVPGAAHENLYAVAGAEYERRVLAFLGRYVGKDAVRGSLVGSARGAVTATPASAATPGP